MGKQSLHDLGIGALHAAQVPAEAVLVQLLMGLFVPEAAGVGADLVRQNDRAAGAAEVGEESGSEPLPKYVALTFDDGPRADTTSVLLEGLQQRGVKVTFFLIGEQIEDNEWLVRWMAENGHQIGSHTFSHQKLAGSGKDTILQEINKTEVLLSSVLGEGREYWLRPPYGLIDEAGKKLVKTPMVYWSVDPEDWKVLDADKVSEHVCSHVQDGDIILLHDFYPTSVEAALRIVDRLQEEGYEFVTVEELLRLNGTKAEAGKLYRNAWEERL